jgi:hypothetical protein
MRIIDSVSLSIVGRFFGALPPSGTCTMPIRETLYATRALLALRERSARAMPVPHRNSLWEHLRVTENNIAQYSPGSAGIDDTLSGQR